MTAPARTPDTTARIALALLLLAVGVYVWGLGGQNIPRNGDEMVYAHIARLTAQSGQWLPLVSELDHMRNTKPPLLFWQAMVASDWGRHWSLLALRLPSLLYTLATAALCALGAWRITRSRASAALAAAVFLAFLSSFRFGRPYLTSAPETFWLTLPLWGLLWQATAPAPEGGAPRPALPGWGAAVVAGLALGLGAAYKSFALVVPAAAALWVALLWLHGPAGWGRALSITLRVKLAGWLGLAVFGLWFALDPDPGAVWREFVVGENAGKMGRDSGYWRAALVGSSSIWVQALAYLQNAGLLALPLLGLGGLGLQAAWNVHKLLSKTKRSSTGWASGLAAWLQAPPPWLRVLLAWTVVWLVVFCVPSTRSARYVIPAMPVLAVLLAVYWQRVGRAWWLAALALCALCLLALGRVLLALAGLGLVGTGDAVLAGLVFGAAAVSAALALRRPAATREAALGACLLVWGAFNATVAPLDGPAGRYPPAVLSGARLWVPSGFNGSFERFEFLLPGNRITPYTAPADAGAAERAWPDLLARLRPGDALVWAEPVAHAPAPCAAGAQPACEVMAMRWEIKGRHQSGDITWANLWQPEQWLLRREWLLRRPAP